MVQLARYYGKSSHINSCTVIHFTEVRAGNSIRARKLGSRWWPAKAQFCFLLSAPLSSSPSTPSYKSWEILIFISWLRCYFFNVVTSSEKTVYSLNTGWPGFDKTSTQDFVFRLIFLKIDCHSFRIVCLLLPSHCQQFANPLRFGLCLSA